MKFTSHMFFCGVNVARVKHGKHMQFSLWLPFFWSENLLCKFDLDIRALLENYLLDGTQSLMNFSFEYCFYLFTNVLKTIHLFRKLMSIVFGINGPGYGHRYIDIHLFDGQNDIQGSASLRINVPIKAGVSRKGLNSIPT